MKYTNKVYNLFPLFIDSVVVPQGQGQAAVVWGACQSWCWVGGEMLWENQPRPG